MKKPILVAAVLSLIITSPAMAAGSLGGGELSRVLNQALSRNVKLIETRLHWAEYNPGKVLHDFIVKRFESFPIPKNEPYVQFEVDFDMVPGAERKSASGTCTVRDYQRLGKVFLSNCFDPNSNEKLSVRPGAERVGFASGAYAYKGTEGPHVTDAY